MLAHDATHHAIVRRRHRIASTNSDSIARQPTTTTTTTTLNIRIERGREGVGGDARDTYTYSVDYTHNFEKPAANDTCLNYSKSVFGLRNRTAI